MNYLPTLASNHDPPDFCLLSSKDYRRDPRCRTASIHLNSNKNAMKPDWRAQQGICELTPLTWSRRALLNSHWFSQIDTNCPSKELRFILKKIRLCQIRARKLPIHIWAMVSSPFIPESLAQMVPHHKTAHKEETAGNFLPWASHTFLSI
jgi:hypothetical protein